MMSVVTWQLQTIPNSSSGFILLQVVAGCCSGLQLDNVSCDVAVADDTRLELRNRLVAGCCRLLQVVAGCCRLLQVVVGCCSGLQLDDVSCDVAVADNAGLELRNLVKLQIQLVKVLKHQLYSHSTYAMQADFFRIHKHIYIYIYIYTYVYVYLYKYT